MAHDRYSHTVKDSFKDNVYVSGAVDSVRPVAMQRRELMNLITISNCKASVPLAYKRVSVYCKASDLVGIEPGDVIKMRFRLARNKGKILPGGYDFGLQNLINKIDLSGYSFAPPVLLCKGGSFGLLNSLTKLRYKYYKSINSFMQRDVADFAAALIIGESKGLDREIMNNMRCAGLSHVLCVSGMHLTLIAGICFFGFRTLLNSVSYIALSCNIKVFSAALSWFASAFYWMLSGMNVATTRAFIMTSVGIIAVIFDKKACSFRTLTLAMLVVLCVNPADMMSVSFQLSFASVLALIGGSRLFAHFNKSFSGLFGKFYSAMFANFYSSLVVSCITAPIAIYQFYTFATYQILGNLAVLPIVSVFLMPITVMALILIPLGCAESVLGIMSYGINLVISIASFLSYLPFSLLYFGTIGWSSIVAYVIGVCWFLCWKSRLRFFGVMLILAGFFGEIFKNKADLIVDYNNRAIGINQHGYLNIYGDRSSSFLCKYWTNWFGQRQIICHKIPLNEGNFSLYTNSGLKVLIVNRAEDNLEADLIISRVERIEHAAAPLIGKKDLEKLGSIAIYCKNDRFEIYGTKGKLVLPFRK